MSDKTLSPWSEEFRIGNRIVVKRGDEIQHYDGLTESGDFYNIPTPETIEKEAPGKLNVYTGEYTYSDKAVGARKTPAQLERIRRNYISSQRNLLCGTLSDKFKSAKSAAEIFKYVDEELDDKNDLVNDITYSIRRIREERKIKSELSNKV